MMLLHGIPNIPIGVPISLSTKTEAKVTKLKLGQQTMGRSKDVSRAASSGVGLIESSTCSTAVMAEMDGADNKLTATIGGSMGILSSSSNCCFGNCCCQLLLEGRRGQLSCFGCHYY